MERGSSTCPSGRKAGLRSGLPQATGQKKGPNTKTRHCLLQPFWMYQSCFTNKISKLPTAQDTAV
jgi:hypothetical protein